MAEEFKNQILCHNEVQNYKLIYKTVDNYKIEIKKTKEEKKLIEDVVASAREAAKFWSL